jgi:polyketide biosynthesis acyl carrier protein
MDKNEIFAVVCKHIEQNVQDVDSAPIELDSTLASCGATSLDIVEIVSGVTRELRVKVPRTELARLENIGDLVDLLYARKQAEAVVQ